MPDAVSPKLKESPGTEERLLAVVEAVVVMLQALGWIAVTLGRMTQESKDQLKESDVCDGGKMVLDATTHEVFRVIGRGLGRDVLERLEKDLSAAVLDKAQLADILKRARDKTPKEN